LSDTVTNPFQYDPMPQNDPANGMQDAPVADAENGWTANEAAAVGHEDAVAEVDTPEALDDEAEDTVADGAAGEGAKQEKAPKEPKAPARATPPDGLITPVQFAKVLTEHLEAKGFSNKNGPVTAKSATSPGNPIPPQYIYSMLSQSQKPNAKNPVPTYVSDHAGNVYKTGEQPEGTPLARVNLLKETEALAWWDEKDSRVAASKTAKAEKAAKAAEKAAATPTAPVVEAEAPADPIVEAE
jgi:hypothetical protein